MVNAPQRVCLCPVDYHQFIGLSLVESVRGPRQPISEQHMQSGNIHCRASPRLWLKGVLCTQMFRHARRPKYWESPAACRCPTETRVHATRHCWDCVDWRLCLPGRVETGQWCWRACVESRSQLPAGKGPTTPAPCASWRASLLPTAGASARGSLALQTDTALTDTLHHR